MSQMMPWSGDSTLLVEPAAFTMTLIDDHARRVRTMGLSRTGVSDCFVLGRPHMPLLDSDGDAICRLPPARIRGAPSTSRDVPVLDAIENSAALIRYQFTSRRIDTITFLQSAKTQTMFVPNEKCAWFLMPAINPVPDADEWTVTADGSIVIVRGADFRVEWLDPDGSPQRAVQLQAVRLPFTANQKVRFLDSAKASLGQLRWSTLRGAGAVDSVAPIQPKCGAVRKVTVLSTGASDDPKDNLIFGLRGSGVPLPFVPPEMLPDSLPFFSAGGVRADGDGNVWIRSYAPVDGQSLYRVLDRGGQEIAQLLVPAGRDIVGFGANRAVYLAATEPGGLRLERARWE